MSTTTTTTTTTTTPLAKLSTTLQSLNTVKDIQDKERTLSDYDVVRRQVLQAVSLDNLGSAAKDGRYFKILFSTHTYCNTLSDVSRDLNKENYEGLRYKFTPAWSYGDISSSYNDTCNIKAEWEPVPRKVNGWFSWLTPK